MQHVLTPLTIYHQSIAEHKIEANSEQADVMQYLNEVYLQLIQQQKQSSNIFQSIKKWFARARPVTFKESTSPIRGLYIYGNVGTGKTMLIDIFYHCLPISKMRLHFHAFMDNIHNELRKLQGQKNPLVIIANQIAAQTNVICFDEFFVHNVADAMLLAELFKTLFKAGVCLIATSNTKPDELYRNGLQRERFLPAIELIKKNTQVMHLTLMTDYRRLWQTSKALKTYYYTPLNAENQQQLHRCFQELSHNAPCDVQQIEIWGRPIKIEKMAHGLIWFDFFAICGRPRSQKDYLEIAKQYHTVFISNVPSLNSLRPDLVTSFIHLIDVLYDRHIRLIVSAAVSAENLYTVGSLRASFKRTESRLIEMQSLDYFHTAVDASQKSCNDQRHKDHD